MIDALVIGAGPAGLTVALRLQQLGHRVLVVERSAGWPRAHVGEALTPGIQNIVALLDAHDALADVPLLTDRPMRLLWRSSEVETLPPAGAALVERAAFDAGLLALAQRRGVTVAMPAHVVSVAGSAGAWRVVLQEGGTTREVATRFILDASGRNGVRHVATAPRLAACWLEFAPAGLSSALLAATQTEALEDGWLWGARLPGGSYRAMLVADPGGERTGQLRSPEGRLRAACAASRLFDALAHQAAVSAVQMCAATPGLAPDGWQPGRLKIGDAAFALDPVSSSGVEKAMRFSLQAAVAVNTLLRDDSASRAALVREFFEHRLIDTCARHTHWTAASYGQAWCAALPFWRQRADILPHDEGGNGAGLVARLHAAHEELRAFREPPPVSAAALDPRRPLRLSDAARIVALPCVVDDQVAAGQALAHPHLERPVAYLENEALVPHLDAWRQAQLPEQMVHRLARHTGTDKAHGIVGWLRQRGVLESAG